MKTVTITVEKLQELMTYAASEAVWLEMINEYEREFPHMLDGQHGIRVGEHKKELQDKLESLCTEVGLSEHELMIVRFRTYEESQEETALGIPGVCIAGPEDFDIEPDECDWCIKVFGPVAERE